MILGASKRLYILLIKLQLYPADLFKYLWPFVTTTYDSVERNYFFQKNVRRCLWKHALFVLFVSSVLCLYCERFVKFEFRSKSENVSFLLLRSTYKRSVFIYSTIQDKGSRNIRRKGEKEVQEHSNLFWKCLSRKCHVSLRKISFFLES